MDIQLTLNNHFKFGYDGTAFNFRKSKNEHWFASYGKCSRVPQNFKHECFNTAKLIHDSHKNDIWILFSGGIDSEVTLRSFVEQNLKVKVAILRFANDLNIHDISWAVIVCESLNVPYFFFDLDILKFWQESIFEYADKTQCITPMLPSIMWLVDQIDGYCVMGSGECLLVKRKPEGYVPGISPYEYSSWDLWEKEKIAAWYRHFIVHKKEGCPGFFQYTPELMLAFLNDEIVQSLVNCKEIGKLSTESSKYKIYNNYFNLIHRPKYTGFEKVMPQSKIVRARLENLFSYHNEVFQTEYFKLVKYLQYVQ